MRCGLSLASIRSRSFENGSAAFIRRTLRSTKPCGARVVHLEAQTYCEQNIPQRFAEYGPLRWFKYRLPVSSHLPTKRRKECHDTCRARA